MHETGTKLLESKLLGLLEKFPDAILDAVEERGDLTLRVDPKRIRDVVYFLKNAPALRFDLMADLFAMDYQTFVPVQPERFAVIYNLASLFQKGRVFLKCFLPEGNPEIDSIYDLYAAANWFEREAYDLYGISFRGHPHLVRILCHQDFEGHALRKDYPSTQYQRLKSATVSAEV